MSIERVVGGLTIAIPTVGTALALYRAATRGLDRIDMALFVAMYVITMVAVEVGFHRMIVHRGFRTGPLVRAVLIGIGSMGAIGPIGWWTANHRQHHAFTDVPGDPHTPHDHAPSLFSRAAAFWHSHAGWLVNPESIATDPRYAGDVYRDPVLLRVHRMYFPLVASGLLLPAVVGGMLHGSFEGAIGGLLWGGFVRMFCVHHAVWALGSFGHVYGTQEFETRDQARNNLWVAIVTLGEGWHHNHHVFPSSARHGLRWWQIDVNYWFIRLLATFKLAWGVKVPSLRAQALKRRTRPLALPGECDA